MLTAKEIRESFKDFFRERGHQIVPSAPMVIKDDPTLMFTNAGMNQFKDIILGNVPAKYKRVADSQKCLRVSGKHNDLEEVGLDTYHHTMFEMLGNWSFGDYFKKEAIDWSWEYLVDVLKIDPARLYATVFEGYASEGLERDNEAASYWEAHLPKDHIINGNRHDNFWEMGDTGPCGPCSEIHIDLRSDAERAEVDGLKLVNQSHPQVIEIWNLVFMQSIPVWDSNGFVWRCKERRLIMTPMYSNRLSGKSGVFAVRNMATILRSILLCVSLQTTYVRLHFLLPTGSCHRMRKPVM